MAAERVGENRVKGAEEPPTTCSGRMAVDKQGVGALATTVIGRNERLFDSRILPPCSRMREGRTK
jgi:hypothetical protein